MNIAAPVVDLKVRSIQRSPIRQLTHLRRL